MGLCSKFNMQHFWHSNGQGCTVLHKVLQPSTTHSPMNTQEYIFQKIHSFFWRMRQLYLTVSLATLSPEVEGHLGYPPHHAALPLMCCHTGQKGSYISRQCCEHRLVCRSHVFTWKGTEPASSPVTGQYCISANAISFLQLTPRAERRYWRGLLASEWINQSHHQKRHKPNMKCYWRRKLNTTSWPLPLRSWKRMILHTKQKCTRFSTLATQWCYKRGSEGSPDELHIHRGGISLAVTTTNAFSERNISREQTPAFLILKEKQNGTANPNSFSSNVLEGKIVLLQFSLLIKFTFFPRLLLGPKIEIWFT